MGHIQIQSCKGKKPLDALSVTLCPSKGALNLFLELIHTVRNVVRQIGVLGFVPQLFRRIEFWRIGREPFHIEPIRMLLREQPDGLTVNAIPIQDQDGSAAKMPPQIAQECQEMIGVGVAAKDLKVKAKPLSPWRHRNGANRGKPVPTIPAIVLRCLTLGCPCSPDHRLKLEAGLIQEDNGMAASMGFFLSGANLCESSAGWRFRPVLWPSALAFADSSAFCGEYARRNWGGR